MKEDIKKIAVIGAGTMGHGIAQSFAQVGYKVSLMDSVAQSLDRALSLIVSSLSAMAQEDMIDRSLISTIISRITLTTSLEEAAQDVDIAFECVVEDEGAKKDVFSRLDAFCPPRTLLASNTT